MFDYETLKILWWALIGLLLIGFAIMDGFDLGAAMLLRYVGRTDDERRVVTNSVGPTWDGNQVWLVLGAGAVFAAWPMVYATAFSTLYPAMLAALFALFFRPTGFEYRSKLSSARWRGFWDWGLTVGGLMPALIFGIAFGLLFTGLHFHFDREMRIVSDGGILDEITAFSLLSGLVSVAMLAMHGAAFLNTKTRDLVQQRARTALRLASRVFVALFALAGLWIAFGIDGHHVERIGDVGTALPPTGKSVGLGTGGWLDNFRDWPLFWLAPIVGLGGGWLAGRLAERPRMAFVCSAAALAGVILTAGLALFPFMLPSASLPDHGLTVWDASSSQRSLGLMLLATAIFMPLIVAYTAWVYRVLRGPIRLEDVRRNDYGSY